MTHLSSYLSGRLVWRGLVFLGTAALLVWHAHETVSRFPPGRPDPASLPFTQHDHTMHFYYGQLTTQFFAHRRAFWGYDPTFMAGYAKSLVYPPSSTPAELACILFPGYAAFVYRLYVAATVFLTPLFLGLAARVLAQNWGAFVSTLWIAVLWVWCGWPSTYVVLGLTAFILVSGFGLCGAAMLTNWFDNGSIRSLFAGGTMTVLALIAHPLSVAILFGAVLPGYLSRARCMGWRAHLATWAVPVIGAVAWSPWWLPGVVLRETYGESVVFLFNENVRGRLQEIVTAQFPEETALWLAALGAIWGLRGMGSAKLWSLVGGVSWFFVLGYLAGALPWTRTMQPGRFTQPLYAWLAVLVGVGYSRLGAARSNRSERARRWVICSVIVDALVAVALVAPKAGTYLLNASDSLAAELPPWLHDMVAHLRTHTDSSGRILFEDRGRLSLGRQDPFGHTNPAALMPLLAPGQYIGGPYLYTNLKSNFTQCGDGLFFGRSLQYLDRDTVERYARLYNIRWLVVWSAPWVRLAERHPDLFRLDGEFGYLRLYELLRATNWAVRGSASVHARPDELDVHDARPGPDGVLILSYHWIATLRSSVALRSVYLADDPVPFIAVDDPPQRFVIENRLW